MQSRVLDNQDMLIAIFMRVKDPESISQLAAVSKQFRAAAQSDPVWRCAILAFFGEKVLSLALESIENHDVRARYPFTTHNQEQEQDVAISAQQPWTLRSAFHAIVIAVSETFHESPEDAIGALTHGLSIDEAGAVAASYICWCSPRRRGLPDIRTQAIRFMTEPKPSPGRPLSKAARKAFVAAVDARGAPLGAALRRFLARIVMPCEASRVGRILWTFAEHYALQNPAPAARVADGPAAAEPAKLEGDVLIPGLPLDEVYMLIWSMLVLNTDAHNPKVAVKMPEAQWVRNTLQALRAPAAAAAAAAPAAGPGPTPPLPAVGEPELRALFAGVLRAPLLDPATGAPPAAAAAAARAAPAGGGGWAAVPLRALQSLRRLLAA